MHPCPYFARAVRKIAVPGLLHPMRVPTCRCALIEEAVSRLSTQPSGVEFANAFSSANQADEQWPLLGPDLEGIAANQCTQTRRTEKCCPAFAEMLTSFELESDFLTEAA